MHSFIAAAMVTGITVRVAAPAPVLPDPALIARAGTAVRVCETPEEATAGADAVITAGHPRPTAAAADLVPVEQALVRALVTGDWEV
jgi:ornithine carbamoyltransferase